MKPPRLFVSGRWNYDRSRAIRDPQASELDNVVPLRPDLPPIAVAVTGGVVPLRRRVRRVWREFVAFLLSPCWR